MSRLNRRDFLKFGSILSGALAFSRLARPLSSSASQPNVLIFVFDAMTAKNLSLYGYHRNTTPNLERFAEHATVYDHHYSTSNFTTPGAASILTGLYPWTHRAINNAGLVARELTDHNIFRLFGKQYYRLAFSQNLWPNYFFGQFEHDIERILSPAAFSLVAEIFGNGLPRDRTDSHRAFDDFLFEDGRPPSALVFGLAERFMLRRAVARAPQKDYPLGLPRAGLYPIFFTLKDVFDGMLSTVESLPSPSLAYLHDWAPHEPFRPSKDFAGRFVDGWHPIQKPDHLLSAHWLPSHMNMNRHIYDEYIANVDFEFGRLLDSLEARGILNNSYVVVTSDHGEMFERGVEGHVTPLLYESVVQVPLLISAPGQKSRQDVHGATSSVDLLPTLVRLAGGEAPAWSEGQALPGLGGQEQPERSIFMMNAAKNPAFSSLSFASFALRKGPYKLLYYRGFPEYHQQDKFELYDIESDPEELIDLYPQGPSVAKALQDELLAKIDAENARFG